MRVSTALLPAASALAAAAGTAGPSVQELFSNPAGSSARIPSVHESAVQARRILHIQPISTVSTIFPPAAGEVSGQEQRPADVGNTAMGLMEYHADCGPEPWNPTVLGVTVSTTMKNAAAGSNLTMSARYMLPANAPQPPPDPWAYLSANLPRFALIGTLERLNPAEVERHNLSACFLERHPDAAIWAPGSDVHDSWWGRVVVNEVYFFGGFGDRSRIGWLPIDEWRGVTSDEILSYRLVGEEGYRPKANPGSPQQLVLANEL